jgi:hypothetical protein
MRGVVHDGAQSTRRRSLMDSFNPCFWRPPSGVPQRKPSSAPAAFRWQLFSLVRDSLVKPQPGLLLLGGSGSVIWDLTQSLNTHIYGIRHRKSGLRGVGEPISFDGSCRTPRKSGTQARYRVKFVWIRSHAPPLWRRASQLADP